MTSKIKKISKKINIIAVAFLFACNSGNRPPTLADIQRECISSVTASDTITEISENSTCSAEVDNRPRNTISTEADSIPRNTKWADAEGNPRYAYFDVYGKQHTANYFLMDVKPLYNGKDLLEELNKYFEENNKLIKEIAEKENIMDATFSVELTIKTDGSIDVRIREEMTTHQVLGEEYATLWKSMQEHGKFTPGEHNGKVLNANIPAFLNTYKNKTK